MLGLISYFLFPAMPLELKYFQNSLIVSGFVFLVLISLFIAFADRADEIDTRTAEGRRFFEDYIRNITNRWVLVAILLGLFGYLGLVPAYYVFKREKVN